MSPAPSSKHAQGYHPCPETIRSEPATTLEVGKGNRRYREGKILQELLSSHTAPPQSFIPWPRGSRRGGGKFSHRGIRWRSIWSKDSQASYTTACPPPDFSVPSGPNPRSLWEMERKAVPQALAGRQGTYREHCPEGGSIWQWRMSRRRKP